jgi:hypothetical protein
MFHVERGGAFTKMAWLNISSTNEWITMMIPDDVATNIKHIFFQFFWQNKNLYSRPLYTEPCLMIAQFSTDFSYISRVSLGMMTMNQKMMTKMILLIFPSIIQMVRKKNSRKIPSMVFVWLFDDGIKIGKKREFRLLLEWKKK